MAKFENFNHFWPLFTKKRAENDQNLQNWKNRLNFRICHQKFGLNCIFYLCMSIFIFLTFWGPMFSWGSTGFLGLTPYRKFPKSGEAPLRLKLIYRHYLIEKSKKIYYNKILLAFLKNAFGWWTTRV